MVIIYIKIILFCVFQTFIYFITNLFYEEYFNIYDCNSNRDIVELNIVLYDNMDCENGKYSPIGTYTITNHSCYIWFNDISCESKEYLEKYYPINSKINISVSMGDLCDACQTLEYTNKQKSYTLEKIENFYILNLL